MTSEDATGRQTKRGRSTASAEFAHVTKRFGDSAAVDQLSLKVEPGEFIAIVGPSGCGKTTMLRLLAGLEQPDEGEIRLGGDVVNGRPAWRRHAPMVWQNYALFPFMSVAKNVEFALRPLGVPAKQRSAKVQASLARLGIEHLADRQIGQLSGGQRQRVAIARALVQEPDILLLDEPLSALDAHLRVRMQSELRQMHRELGITFFYVTHYQSEALSMADRIVVMDQGVIEQVGTPEDIYRRPRNRFVAEFVGANNVFAGEVIATADGVVDLATAAGQISLPTDDHDFVIGTTRDFAVGADSAYFGRQGVAGEQTVSGVMRGNEFVGSIISHHVELSDGTTFRVDLTAASAREHAPGLGEIVEVSWPLTAGVVLEAST